MRAALLAAGAALAIVVPAVADQPNGEAQALYDKVQARLKASQSVSGVFEVRSFGETEVFRFKFLRPNYASFVSKISAVHQTGASLFWYSAQDRTYTVEPAAAAGMPSGAAFNLGGVLGLEGAMFPNEPGMVATKVTKRAFAGKACNAIQFTSPANKTFRGTLYVDAKSGLPAGWTYAAGGFEATGVIRELALNPSLKPAEFAYSPPKGAARVKTD